MLKDILYLDGRGMYTQAYVSYVKLVIYWSNITICFILDQHCQDVSSQRCKSACQPLAITLSSLSVTKQHSNCGNSNKII